MILAVGAGSEIEPLEPITNNSGTTSTIIDVHASRVSGRAQSSALLSFGVPVHPSVKSAPLWNRMVTEPSVAALVRSRWPSSECSTVWVTPHSGLPPYAGTVGPFQSASVRSSALIRQTRTAFASDSYILAFPRKASANAVSGYPVP